jgi:DNA/RNA-binding domain of Phe-tRNA-synthetase-like protein
MRIDVKWSPNVLSKLRDLAICTGTSERVCIQKDNEQLRRLKQIVYQEVRSKYEIDRLKEDSTVRAFRDFYWRLGIDPTKTRPSGEALLRRVLRGEGLPCISNVVDAYNLASMKTIIPISGFDLDRLAPQFQVRFAEENESFKGIGMKTSILLRSNMLVLADVKRVLCIYPYRDCDHTKIATTTRNVEVVGYGAPGISPKQVRQAVETALSFITTVAGGKVVETKVYPSRSEH